MRSVWDSMDGASEVARLRAENDRLIALLESHGIDWHASQPATLEVREPEPSRLSTAKKVSLFRRLFRGRTAVYPIRWEAKTSGKSGYSPACANEWRAGACEKPRIKCGDCGNRVLIPLSDVVIYGHLAGEHTVGVYPLLEDDSCYFLAVDFDDAEWREDARAFMQACEALGVPAALEISRSGSGANNAGKSSALQALHFAVAVAQTARLVGDGVNWAKGKFQVSFNPTQLLYSPVPDVLSLAHGGQLQEPQESVNWSVFGRRQHSVHRGSYERILS